MDLVKIKLPIDVEDDFVCSSRMKAISSCVDKKVLLFDWHEWEVMGRIDGANNNVEYNVTTLDGKKLSLAYYDLHSLFVFC